MSEYEDLDAGRHIVGETFDRLLDLNVSVASFAVLELTISKVWAPQGARTPDDSSNLIARATLANGRITQTDTQQIRTTIPGSALEVPPRTYVYDVRGVTLLGDPVVLVRGLLPMGPHA